MFGAREVHVHVAREPEDARALEELRARVDALEAELATLRREGELRGFALQGLQERQDALYRFLEREGAIPRRSGRRGGAAA